MIRAALPGSRARLVWSPEFNVVLGDELIEIKIVAPKPADGRSRELLEEFARLNPQSPRAGLPWS